MLPAPDMYESVIFNDVNPAVFIPPQPVGIYWRKPSEVSHSDMHVDIQPFGD
jgi:hypothetical protein